MKEGFTISVSNPTYPKNEMRPALITVVVYAAIMAAGQMVMRYVGGVNYGTTAMLLWLFPAELVMSAWTLFAVRRFASFEQVGLGKVISRARWWDRLGTLLPVGIALWVSYTWTRELAAPVDWITVLVGTVTIACVAFSEELVFRGIVLSCLTNIRGVRRVLSRWSQALIDRRLAAHDLTTVSANVLGVVMSAFLFSIFHGINYLGGYPTAAVMYQLIGTLGLGLVFGGLALALPSLRPLIAWHFLWDYYVIMGTYFQTLQS